MLLISMGVGSCARTYATKYCRHVHIHESFCSFHCCHRSISARPQSRSQAYQHNHQQQQKRLTRTAAFSYSYLGNSKPVHILFQRVPCDHHHYHLNPLPSLITTHFHHFSFSSSSSKLSLFCRLPLSVVVIIIYCCYLLFAYMFSPYTLLKLTHSNTLALSFTLTFHPHLLCKSQQ